LLKDRFIADIYGEAGKLIGSQVRVCGWVDNIRDLGGVRFVLVRDRTGVMQVVVKKGLTPQDSIDASYQLVKESVACFEGTLSEGPSKLKYELHATKVQPLSKPVEPSPPRAWTPSST